MDQKVIDLTAATAVTGADLLYVSQSATDKQLPVEVLRKLAPNCLTAVFGDANDSDSIEVGQTCFVRVPYGGTLLKWTLIANVSCSCVVDVWKTTSALPTNGNSITASAKPTLASATVGSSSTLTGWTIAVVEDDVFGFELESLTGVPSEITLVLKVV